MHNVRKLRNNKPFYLFINLKRMITNDKRINIPSMHSTSRHMCCRVLLVVIEERQTCNEVKCIYFRAVKKDSNHIQEPFLGRQIDNKSEIEKNQSSSKLNKGVKEPSNIKCTEEDAETYVKADSSEEELMQQCARLEHASFNKLRLLVTLGALLKRLLNAKILKYRFSLCRLITKKA